MSDRCSPFGRRLRVSVKEFVDVGLVELVEQLPAAFGQGHGLVSVAGAVDEGRADVGFDAVELKDQVLVEQAERGGGGVDAGVGGDLLEAAQSLPAVAFAFGGVADVVGQVGVGAAVDAVAGCAGGSPVDAEPVAVAADGFAGDAEFGADVAVGALAGLDLLA
jgi:hypothetical protein